MQIMTSSPIQGQGQSWGLEPRSEWQPSMRTTVQMWMIYDNYGYRDIHNLEYKTFTETLLLTSTKQTNLSKVRTTKNYIPLGNKYRGYNDKKLNREKNKRMSVELAGRSTTGLPKFSCRGDRLLLSQTKSLSTTLRLIPIFHNQFYIYKQ